MRCKIADLLIEIPEAGGLASRCREYLTEETSSADIIIRADRYRPERYSSYDDDGIAYMESGAQFCRQLLNFNGFYLHSSAVAVNGKGYLFSGPCGMGKSTHTGLWQQVHGEAAAVFNDDKPALRCIDGRWYAYGTPWSGKNAININMKVPLVGICFLKRGQTNIIRRLEKSDALVQIISQTIRRFEDPTRLDLLLSHVENLVERIPVYELYNKPEPEAAWLSFETMRRGAEEAGL